ncbi:MAG: SRPBCC family protein [Thaumarchaeota archaeon]|nr:SRPBCC family protein [Nitrososphaerota archaeon]
MPILEKSVEVLAPPEVVWSIIADPSFVPKLYPHVISVTPGHSRIATVGKSVTITAKAVGRKMTASLVATEVVPNTKFSYKHLPDGFFDKYLCSIELEPTKKGTRLNERVEYEAHAGYLGKAMSKLVAHKVIKDNVLQSLKNVKEIAELEEHTGSRTA